MSGLLRRLTRRPAATAGEPHEGFDPDATPRDAPAEPGGEAPVSPEVAAWTGSRPEEQAAPTQVIPGVAERAAAGEPAATPIRPDHEASEEPAAPNGSDAPPAAGATGVGIRQRPGETAIVQRAPLVRRPDRLLSQQR